MDIKNTTEKSHLTENREYAYTRDDSLMSAIEGKLNINFGRLILIVKKGKVVRVVEEQSYLIDDFFG